MIPITYNINFPVAAHIQRTFDTLSQLSPDQKIELAIALGQRALDEMKAADVIRRDMEKPDAIDDELCEDHTAAWSQDIQDYQGVFNWKSFEQ